ncbi:hypothetical protein J6590_075857 [Homalodisca vitripennis]|nr:hypothetical protein J6590_075857 [Homalodisca vitripennis]
MIRVHPHRAYFRLPVTSQSELIRLPFLSGLSGPSPSEHLRLPFLSRFPSPSEHLRLPFSVAYVTEILLLLSVLLLSSLLHQNTSDCHSQSLIWPFSIRKPQTAIFSRLSGPSPSENLRLPFSVAYLALLHQNTSDCHFSVASLSLLHRNSSGCIYLSFICPFFIGTPQTALSQSFSLLHLNSSFRHSSVAYLFLPHRNFSGSHSSVVYLSLPHWNSSGCNSSVVLLVPSPSELLRLHSTPVYLSLIQRLFLGCQSSAKY